MSGAVMRLKSAIRSRASQAKALIDETESAVSLLILQMQGSAAEISRVADELGARGLGDLAEDLRLEVEALRKAAS